MVVHDLVTSWVGGVGGGAILPYRPRPGSYVPWIVVESDFGVSGRYLIMFSFELSPVECGGIESTKSAGYLRISTNINIMISVTESVSSLKKENWSAASAGGCLVFWE